MMFNFTEVFKHLHNGQFEMALGILQEPLYDNRPIDLSTEDKQQLLSILVVLHELTIGLPENTGELEHQYQQFLQAGPQDFAFDDLLLNAQAGPQDFAFDALLLNAQAGPQDFAFDDLLLNEQAAPIEPLFNVSSNIYSVSSCIIDVLRRLLERSEGRVHHEFSARAGAESTDSSLIEFLLNEENHARGFLRNAIFQEYIVNYARDSRTPFFHRLMTDPAFTNYICQDINPNYFLGKANEDILTCASRYEVSAEVYDALVFHGADVNGRGTRPSFFQSHITRQVNNHSEDPMQNHRSFFSLRRQAPGAKVFFQNGPKTPLIEAILSDNFEHVKCLLASPKIILTRNEQEPLEGCRSMSPLMLAAYLGRLDMVQALLVRGANINEVDNVGESAIFYALRANRLAVFFFLFERPEVNKNLINHQGQVLQDLMHSFNYPGLAAMFSPAERLVLLINKRPGFLRHYILDLLEKRLSIIVTELKKEDIVPFLASQQEELAPSHLLYFPRNRPNCFMGTFLMTSENHMQLPAIYADLESANCSFKMPNQKTYVVKKAANDETYSIYNSYFSLDKTNHLLIFAHHLQRLQYFPVDCVLQIFSYLGAEEILNLFETPEEAIQILNDPELDNPHLGHGSGI